MRPTAAARAAKAAHRQLLAASEPPRLAPLPVLPPDIAAAVAAYKPKGLSADVWAGSEAATRAAMTAYQPPSTRWVKTSGGHISRFCAWVLTVPTREAPGTPLDSVELLAPGLLEAYLAGPVATMPDASRATVRSVLRRTLRNLSAAPGPQKVAYTPVAAPYTPAECASFMLVARHQPTAARRRQMLAIVGLGLGAGLDGRDLRGITPACLREHDPGDGGAPLLLVDVPGPRARTVVVRDAYAGAVRDAVAGHRAAGRGDSDTLLVGDLGRDNISSTITARATTALGRGVAVDSRRLRSTWLVAAMSAPVPLSELLAAAGLSSARTLVDLLPHCPAPDPADVSAALRAAGGVR